MTNPLRPFTVKQRRAMYVKVRKLIGPNSHVLVCIDLHGVAAEFRNVIFDHNAVFTASDYFPEFQEQKTNVRYGLGWWNLDAEGNAARVRALTRAIELCDAKIKKGVKY